MSVGNPTRGLLKAIIDVLKENEPEQFVHYKLITQYVIAKGYEDFLTGTTPEQSVKSYLSENREIFAADLEGGYHLRESHRLG